MSKRLDDIWEEGRKDRAAMKARIEAQSQERTDRFLEKLMGSGPFGQRSLGQVLGTIVVFLVMLSIAAGLYQLFT